MEPDLGLDLRWLTHFSHNSSPQAASLSPLSTVTQLTTPLGMPALSHRTHIARAEKGVSAGALITTVHPAARAGASLRVIMAFGKFLPERSFKSVTSTDSQEGEQAYQGVMRPQTPIGCLMTLFLVPGIALGTLWPYVLVWMIESQRVILRQSKVSVLNEPHRESRAHNIPNRLSGEPVYESGSICYFAFGFCQWFPVFRREDQCEIISVGTHEGEEGVEIGLALIGGECRPGG